MVNNRRGRPAGGSNARQRLIDAAEELFLRDGFSRTTIRGIAGHAGVDHALVNYYFGSKEGLFTAVMDLLASPGELVEHATGAGPEHLAPRLLNALLTTWDSPSVQEHSRRLLSAIQTDPTTRDAFRDYLEHQVIAQIAGTLTGRDATARAGAAATVIAGLFLTRYVARVEPIAGMTRPQVVGYLGPALHACLASRPRR
ncbi:TetR/AcrR family transcriptional regulator [Nocardia fusca]|uniref:TetR/AcrR family transcriptional regulator n=1 Tax=Nocardia fusca TaxID=941183 RepID=UPI0007A74AC2|nr:TetR family transcriptional regulator [Nocardia fusca]